MPSWNEKPHTTPTINVNLKPCDCDTRTQRTTAPFLTRHHDGKCSAVSVLIPCPIPRAVTFEVRLGECSARHRPGRCFYHDFETGKAADQEHHPSCPARPIRVTCSIAGETWESSEVSDFDIGDADENPERPPVTTITAMRGRWALVRLLVLGMRPHLSRDPSFRLTEQRDTVFAALRDMVRAEETLSASANIILQSCNDSRRLPLRADDDASPSENLLRRYIGHLVEQVGVLQ